MPDPLAIVSQRLQPAFDRLEAGADPVVRPSDRADAQINGALPLARRLGRNPRELAEAIVEAADIGDICSEVAIAGPGFINLTYAPSFIAGQLATMAGDDRLGLGTVADPATVVIDYSAPNVAKEMHVGHIRSTIIGDALCRILDVVGHRVIRENHVGDWGTPFGMLIEHLLDLGEDRAVQELSVGDLDSFYRQARAGFDADEPFRERSRTRVVLLQSGDPETLRLWRILVDQSIHYFSDVYRRLGVLLTEDDVVGESFYNPMLGDVVRDLDALGLLVDSDGARCVFPPGFANRDGDPLPVIVQKSDGGFGYAATDLAAVRDRVDRLGATVILYVVGAPQAQHLQMVFKTAEMAGWLPPKTRAEHVAFGSMLGADRKPFRTRAGDTVKLVDLLEEAVTRATAAVAAKSPDLPSTERDEVARMIGIGAVKYADLSSDRTRDYVFDWDRMLAFEGNTAPYLQYAHTRIRSIFRRGGVDPAGLDGPIAIDEPAERRLAMQLLGFDGAVGATLDTFSPHKLCNYLYDLATAFTAFYEACPILKAADEAQRNGRLQLAALTAKVLAFGLSLLGIEAPEHM